MKQGIFIVSVFMAITFGACTSIHKSLNDSNSRVNFSKNDFDFSEKLSAEAKTVKILGVDWARLFTKRNGSFSNGGTTPIGVGSLPVVGSIITDNTQAYAIHKLLEQNPGYDAVFYPQYTSSVIKPFLGLGFIVKISDVKAEARLGKLKIK